MTIDGTGPAVHGYPSQPTAEIPVNMNCNASAPAPTPPTQQPGRTDQPERDVPAREVPDEPDPDAPDDEGDVEVSRH